MPFFRVVVLYVIFFSSGKVIWKRKYLHFYKILVVVGDFFVAIFETLHFFFFFKEKE